MNPKNIYFDSGSDCCIKNFIHLFYKNKHNIISTKPSFPMYKVYSEFYNMNIQYIGYKKNLDMDLNKLVKKINNKTRLVILANPNSPLGDFKDKKEINSFCKILNKKKIPLLLDEAYIDFAPHSCLSLLKNNPNLFILRTFSKSWGAAGIRLGYIVGNQEVIKKLYNIQLTYPISNITLKFGNYLLKNSHINKSYSSNTILARNNLCEILKKNNYDVLNSHTNSIHMHEKNNNNSRTTRLLLDAKFAFKYGSKLTGTMVKIPGDNRTNWIRLSVGPNLDKNKSLLKIIKKNKDK
jgi:histidinol-phosphate aminotransferase